MHRTIQSIPVVAAVALLGAPVARSQTPTGSSPTLLPGYNAALVSSDLSRTATGGDVVTFNVQLRNTGSQPWVRDPAGAGQTPVRLALTAGPAPFCVSSAAWEPGFGWLPRSRDQVRLDTAGVAPGEIGSFLFSIQLAQNLTAGTYTFRFRPVAEPNGMPGGAVMTGEIPLTISAAARAQSELDFTGLQLYRANLSVHTANSDGDKLIDLNLPDDRSPTGALGFARSLGRVNILGLTDHGEELSAGEWNGQATAVAAQFTTAAGSPGFLGLRGFKWSGTTGLHEAFGFPWEGSPTDTGHVSIYGTSTWTGTRLVEDGAPPQLTPQFAAPPASDATLAGLPTSLADWLWVNGYPRPNATDNGAALAQFNHPSLFFRSSFFHQFQYEPDLDRFFPMLAVGTGESGAGYTRVPNLVNQISDKGGYRFQGPDTPADTNNEPPAEILALPAGILATLGNPQDSSKWGTNPNNTNRFWFETALRNGWHVAPTLNGDNHAGCYCDDAGYTGIWAKSITGQSYAQAQAAILQALRERAVFASEDRGLSAQFSVFSNGIQYRMGQRNAPLSAAPRFRLDLAATAAGGSPADVAVQDVFLITNDSMTRIGGNLSGPTARLEMTLPIPAAGLAAERFFYALVVKTNGNRLLTAPIWMIPCAQGSCTLSVIPKQGDCTALFVATWTSTGLSNPHLLVDNVDQGPVPPAGSRLLPAGDSGLHTVNLVDSSGSPQTTCQDTYVVSLTAKPPTCQVAVTPATGTAATRFDLAFSAAGATWADLFVDGALLCTQLNPIAGVPYHCFVAGSALVPGTHAAMVVATNCGGTCRQSIPFAKLTPTPPGKGKK
jgi:hypothetical protein